MIELTPLDVRKKRGDFRRAMRGYDPVEVDSFIEIVAERMEALVKENLTLKERAARLQDQVREQGDREKAVQDALVTAQELRKDISGQAQREAELIKREAEAEIERMIMDAEHRAEELKRSAAELERRRRRFLLSYRQHLERELEDVEREASRHPLEEKPLELELHEALAASVASAPAPPTAELATDREAVVGEVDAVHDSAAVPQAAAAAAAPAVVSPEPAPVPEATPAVMSPEPPPVPEAAPAVEATASPEDLSVLAPLVVPVAPSDLTDTGPARLTRPAQSTDSPGPEADAVSVESLAPESDTGPDPLPGWTGAPRLRTEVGSDRAGDPDGL